MAVRPRCLVHPRRRAGARVRREIFVRYTGRIIEEMGGTGERWTTVRARSTTSGRDQHFFLYDDVDAGAERAGGARPEDRADLQLASPLDSFQQHFELEGLITAAVSSSEHGYMKPHPSIFEAAMTLAGVSGASR